MSTALLKQLLEAGVHFGHQSKRWNPKMAPFIFGERNGIYVIDLEKTLDGIIRSSDFLREMASQGGKVLFVGTKKQAQEIVSQEATRCGVFYVTKRWLGGLLTNFGTVKKSVHRLKELMKMEKEGQFKLLSKKEAASLNKEMAKLHKNLFGIIKMDKLPEALFVIDPKKEEIAVKEAKKLGIPVVAIIDTNCNPEEITYPIPGNDDAARAIKLITSLIADSILEGKKAYLEAEGVQEEEEAEETEQKEEPETTEVEKTTETNKDS